MLNSDSNIEKMIINYSLYGYFKIENDQTLNMVYKPINQNSSGPVWYWVIIVCVGVQTNRLVIILLIKLIIIKLLISTICRCYKINLLCLLLIQIKSRLKFKTYKWLFTVK